MCVRVYFPLIIKFVFFSFECEHSRISTKNFRKIILFLLFHLLFLLFHVIFFFQCSYILAFLYFQMKSSQSGVQSSNSKIKCFTNYEWWMDNLTSWNVLFSSCNAKNEQNSYFINTSINKLPRDNHKMWLNKEKREANPKISV